MTAGGGAEALVHLLVAARNIIKRLSRMSVGQKVKRLRQRRQLRSHLRQLRCAVTPAIASGPLTVISCPFMPRCEGAVPAGRCPAFTEQRVLRRGTGGDTPAQGARVCLLAEVLCQAPRLRTNQGHRLDVKAANPATTSAQRLLGDRGSNGRCSCALHKC